jgi:hypothetical protein
MSAFRKLSQEDWDLKTSLVYIARLSHRVGRMAQVVEHLA